MRGTGGGGRRRKGGRGLPFGGSFAYEDVIRWDGAGGITDRRAEDPPGPELRWRERAGEEPAGPVPEGTWRALVAAARRAEAPLAFTGAGISVPSGIPLFEESWRGIPLALLLHRGAWERWPRLCFRFFAEEMSRWGEAEPNPAHRALARLGWPVLTQNFDGLHQRAGSRRVLEVHGNLRTLCCRRCERPIPAPPRRELLGGPRPRCACGGSLRPHLVLIGEPAPLLDEAIDWVRRSDLLVVVGTSLTVGPVNLLPHLAHLRARPVFAINERAERILPALCEALDG